jgi:Uma2 family endonuclease
MKAVVLSVTEKELAQRRLTGIDRFDEMWEGVLHMAPAPAFEHQRIFAEILEFVRPLCKRRGRGMLMPGINVFNEASPKPDYRIPDFSFIAKGREHILADDGTRGGGPDAVMEIRSPEDETYEKLPFFARLGVREIIVIDRDTKRPDIYRLADEKYVVVQTDSHHALQSEVLGVRFIHTESGRVRLEDIQDPTTHVEI